MQYVAFRSPKCHVRLIDANANQQGDFLSLISWLTLCHLSSTDCHSGTAESSEDEGSERVKLRLGTGEGWALKGVSSSCISNEWRQESDAISGPISRPSPENQGGDATYTTTTDPHSERKIQRTPHRSGPCPSVSWACWLLSFLLEHPRLRRLAMRASLFRTLVAYIRSPQAPCRLRTVPLLTLLVRSYAEFEHGPPPLEDLNGLTAAVLQECDRATYGRGPGSAVWRPGDCPGSVQLETKWASEGLLLLTDLVTATRRARDSLKHLDQASSSQECSVRVTLPPFGTRMNEGPFEEGEDGEGDEPERSLADRLMVKGRSVLGAEDRASLEIDLANALLLDTCEYMLNSGMRVEQDVIEGAATSSPTGEPPSRCLHHLLEISDTLQALRDGWSPQLSGSAGCGKGSPTTVHPTPYLDSILCEAWMDAIGPAAVIESEHPFREGTNEDTLHFPGADYLVVYLDPQSSMDLVSRDKN